MILDLLIVVVSLVMIFTGLGFLATLLLVNVRLPFYKMYGGSKDFQEFNQEYQSLMDKFEVIPKARVIYSILVSLLAFLLIYGGSVLVSGLM